MKKKKSLKLYQRALYVAGAIIEETKGECLNPYEIQNQLVEAIKAEDFEMVVLAVAMNETLLANAKQLVDDLTAMDSVEKRVAH